MRGFWHIVDAVLASLIVVGFALILVQPMFTTGEDPSQEVFAELQGLQQQGVLRPLAAAGDYNTINSKVKMYGYNHTVKICDYTGNCAGGTVENGRVWIGNYILAGDTEYEPMVVKLYVWR